MIGSFINDLNNHTSIYTIPLSIILRTKANKFDIISDGKHIYNGVIKYTDNEMIILSLYTVANQDQESMLVEHYMLKYDGTKLLQRELTSTTDELDENDEQYTFVNNTIFNYNNDVLRSSISNLGDWSEKITLYKFKHELLKEWSNTNWAFHTKYVINDSEIKFVEANPRNSNEECVFTVKFEEGKIIKHINNIVDVEYDYIYNGDLLDRIEWEDEVIQFHYIQ